MEPMIILGCVWGPEAEVLSAQTTTRAPKSAQERQADGLDSGGKIPQPFGLKGGEAEAEQGHPRSSVQRRSST